MSDVADWPVFDPGTTWEAAQAALRAAELSDGLPLVVPTEQRLNAMLADCSDPDRSHGLMPPLFGELTNLSIAYNCVLAGCRPGVLPLVAAATAACLDDSFNLLGIATTTGSPAVAAIVHGPIAGTLVLNGEINCLGPGNEANATIGRAIGLVLRNIAGMRPGIADMATMGQPAKYGLCFAEGKDTTFAPFHVRRGLRVGDSGVTVIGISGTAEVLPAQDTGNWDQPEEILRPVALMMRASLLAGGGSRKPEPGEQVLLLPPELAGLIAQRGWQLEDIQRYLMESPDLVGSGPIASSAADIHIIVTGGPGIKMAMLPPWGGGTRAVTRPIGPA